MFKWFWTIFSLGAPEMCYSLVIFEIISFVFFPLKPQSRVWILRYRNWSIALLSTSVWTWVLLFFLFCFVCWSCLFYFLVEVNQSPLTSQAFFPWIYYSKLYFNIAVAEEFNNLYHPELRQDVYIKEEYHYLSVPKVATFTVYDSLDCAFKCLRNPSCLSINLAASKGADGKLWCELLSSEKHSNPNEYKRNKSFHHFFQMVGKLL